MPVYGPDDLFPEAHAASSALKIAEEYKKGEAVVVNMSGRGDKDIFISAMEIDRKNWIDYLKSEVARGENHEN